MKHAEGRGREGKAGSFEVCSKWLQHPHGSYTVKSGEASSRRPSPAMAGRLCGVEGRELLGVWSFESLIDDLTGAEGLRGTRPEKRRTGVETGSLRYTGICGTYRPAARHGGEGLEGTVSPV